MSGVCAGVLAAVLFALPTARTRLAVAGWVLAVACIAASGVLAYFEPPRVAAVLVLTFIGIVFLERRHGAALARLSWAVLVGFQSFRILVELVIHQAAVEGVAPPQLTWFPGWNQDMLTGVSALCLAPFAPRVPQSILRLWNYAGMGLLAWVVGVAVLSLPSPVRQFDTPNVWVAFFPYIGLPVVLVGSALLGHLVVLRKLRADSVVPKPV